MIQRQENLQTMLMTSKLNKEEIDVLRSVSIHTLLGLSNNGRMVKIKCPFHSERTASFALYPDNSYHSYCCGKHGNNAIDFLTHLGYNFNDAIEELATYL